MSTSVAVTSLSSENPVGRIQSTRLDSVQNRPSKISVAGPEVTAGVSCQKDDRNSAMPENGTVELGGVVLSVPTTV
jgi:hypothetical protein